MSSLFSCSDDSGAEVTVGVASGWFSVGAVWVVAMMLVGVEVWALLVVMAGVMTGFELEVVDGAEVRVELVAGGVGFLWAELKMRLHAMTACPAASMASVRS